jgi:membrane peptidoglycan carboxypeptidase
VLYKAHPEATQGTAALSPERAYIMQQLLQDTVSVGHADLARGAAPQTGGMSAATDDFHDAWFVGLNPNLTSALWIGAETGDVRIADTEAKAQDVAEAAWASFMRAVPPRFFRDARPRPVPKGVSFARRGTRTVPFVAGTLPTYSLTPKPEANTRL